MLKRWHVHASAQLDKPVRAWYPLLGPQDESDGVYGKIELEITWTRKQVSASHKILGSIRHASLNVELETADRVAIFGNESPATSCGCDPIVRSNDESETG